MPTWLAACVGPGPPAPADTVRDLLQAQVRSLPVECSIEPFPGGAFGVAIRTDRPRPDFDPLLRGPSGSLLAIAGVPTLARPERVADRMAAAVGADAAGAVRIVTSFDGAFFAAFRDARSGSVVLVTDLLGRQPVYLAHHARRLVLSTTMGSLPAAGVVPPDPDPAGWGGLVDSGRLVGDLTTIAGVTHAPDASVLTYDAAADRLTSRSWWEWPEPDPGASLDRLDTGSLVDTFRESVGRYLDLRAPGVLLLSGGYDSRLVAALLTELGERPFALAVENPYQHLEVEGRLAAMVARAIDLPLERATPPAAFFSTAAYADYVRDSEVTSSSLNLFIAQIDAELAARGAPAFWDGFAFGDALKAVYRTDMARLLDEEMIGLGRRAWRAAARVFARPFVLEMHDRFVDALEREIARYPPTVEGSSRFFRFHGGRRASINPLQVYARRALPLLPGLTRACLAEAARIPAPQKAGGALYRLILMRHFPAAARVPACSCGTLMPGSGRSVTRALLAARSAIVEHERIGNWLRRVGLTPQRLPSALVARALEEVDLDSPTLDADGIRRLRATGHTREPVAAAARELVFYWHAWTRMIDGRSVLEPPRRRSSST